MGTPHGLVDVATQGNVIIVKAKGSFNREGISLFVSTITPQIKAFGNQPFSILMDDVCLEGGTPAAYQELDEYNNWLNSMPLKAKAIVLKSNVIKSMIVANIPSLQQQEIVFFSDREIALDWLVSKTN